MAGSHGGIIAGMLAAQARVHAVILNDAGVGKDAAGIASLGLLESIGMAAATVDRRSAPMGKAELALASGLISHANYHALASGVRPGDRCHDAAQKLCHTPAPYGRLPRFVESAIRSGRHDANRQSSVAIRFAWCAPATTARSWSSARMRRCMRRIRVWRWRLTLAPPSSMTPDAVVSRKESAGCRFSTVAAFRRRPSIIARHGSATRDRCGKAA